MEQYRSRRRGSSKSFHGKYGTIDPARTVAGRSAARVANPRRQDKPQYVAPRGHRQRGGRGPRRRPSRTTALTRLGLIVAALAAIGLAAFLFTRPASAIITAAPDDAMILFDGSVVGTGTLEVEDLEPGMYSVQIERTGYEPVGTTVELKRLRKTKLDYDLEPLPQTVTVTTHPEGAKVTIEPASGKALNGTAPLNAEVLSGRVTLTIEMAGYNTFTREYSIDAPLTLEYYLDPEGQVLHGLGLITTLGAPKGVSVTHDGSEAWTSILDGPPSIQIFDPRTGEQLGGVDIGEYGAVEVIFNKAGTLAYTSPDGDRQVLRDRREDATGACASSIPAARGRNGSSSPPTRRRSTPPTGPVTTCRSSIWPPGSS